MHFSTTALLALAAAGFAVTTPLNGQTLRSEETVLTGPGNGISADTYKNCLNNEVLMWGWTTGRCSQDNRISFWRRGQAWDSAAECFAQCHDDLINKINQGWPEQACTVWVRSAKCEMGYNTQQQ
ncbi:hypothetical protein BGZ60DRAFT_533210 [Tricladium varicosporioides]|nr:hypothetical protein BGZ60DRAFT_533210 [Hymenoscyphus varicosporioides]